MTELTLHQLRSNRGARFKKRIRGRGDSSGIGSYSGRGVKGQRSRTGGKAGLKRLGLKPLLAQTPKLGGFKSRSIRLVIVNVGVLSRIAEEGREIDAAFLNEKGIIPAYATRVKVLGNGTVNRAMSVKAHAFSESAKTAIEKAGGKVFVINPKSIPEERRAG